MAASVSGMLKSRQVHTVADIKTKMSRNRQVGGEDGDEATRQ